MKPIIPGQPTVYLPDMPADFYRLILMCKATLHECEGEDDHGELLQLARELEQTYFQKEEIKTEFM